MPLSRKEFLTDWCIVSVFLAGSLLAAQLFGCSGAQVKAGNIQDKPLPAEQVTKAGTDAQTNAAKAVEVKF